MEPGEDTDRKRTVFETLVPAQAQAGGRRHRRFRASQVDPEDEDAVEAMMDLAEDESVTWEEE